MLFNHVLFRKHCRLVKQKEIAEVLGKSASGTSDKLKKVENIRLHEYLNICALLDVSPTDYIIDPSSNATD